MDDLEITLTLKVPMVNVLLTGLGKLSLEEALLTFQAVRSQADAQIAKAAPAETEA